MAALDYSIIDCDNHYYEPDDCFTRHIEADYKARTVWVDRSAGDGIGRPMLGDERLSFFSAAVGDFVGPPGALKSFFKGETEEGGAVNANAINAYEQPTFVDKQQRLVLMDEQQVGACVMIPTFGCGVEYQLRKPEHRQVAYPTIRSFNRWVAEDWGWGQDARIFGSAMMTLIDIDQAVIELNRLLAEGCRLVQVTVGPIDGKSPADPYFDPFWARMQEAGAVCLYHIGASPYNELYAAQWGEPANPPSHRFTALNMFMGIGGRTIVDQVAATIFHNLFGRFPQLQCMIVEFGASWLPDLLSSLDKNYRMGDHKTRWPYGKPDRSPSEIFSNHFKIVPFFEDDFAKLATAAGVSSLLNGSDFPHPEGLAWPLEMAEELGQFNPAEVRAIMRSNAAGLLGLSA